MLALRPQARFGGQPGRKARLLGRRSSREPRGGANARGRNKSRPYEQIVRFGPIGTTATIRAAVGRDALIPPHPAPPQTPAGGCGIALPPVGADSISARFAAARTPTGGINPAPTTGGEARGHSENCGPCIIADLCRGRCSHRPGTPRRKPAGGVAAGQP